jgi:hypothetical protein
MRVCATLNSAGMRLPEKSNNKNQKKSQSRRNSRAHGALLSNQLRTGVCTFFKVINLINHAFFGDDM